METQCNEGITPRYASAKDKEKKKQEEGYVAEKKIYACKRSLASISSHVSSQSEIMLFGCSHAFLIGALTQ